jgi:hypothetical protein
MRKSVKEIEYVTFILGYDLLHTAFENSGNPETDVVFNRCLDIANDFYKSEYNVAYKDLYTCVTEYLLYSDSFTKFEREYNIFY